MEKELILKLPTKQTIGQKNQNCIFLSFSPILIKNYVMIKPKVANLRIF